MILLSRLLKCLSSVGSEVTINVDDRYGHSYYIGRVNGVPFYLTRRVLLDVDIRDSKLYVTVEEDG
jgi:hypothetical protein